MTDHIKNAVKVFVVTLLVVTGAAFIFSGLASVTFAGFGSVLFGVEVLAIATMSAVSTLVGGLLSKDMDAVSQNFGVKTATRTPTAPRPIIYGECRVGGTVTHIETAGTDNHKLRMIICLAGHEIESLEKIYINDTEATTATVGNFTHVTNSKYVNTDNDNAFTSGRLIRFRFKDGSQTTADSTVTSNSALGANDKFVSVAYIFIEMVFDSEAFGGGIPSFAFRVKGKKVYDPRESSQSPTDPSTWTWSNNPALHVRDYLQDTVYGLKATQDEINDTTNLGGFASAANTCDASSTVTTATNNGAVNNQAVFLLNQSTNNSRISIGMTVTGSGISGTVKVISRNRLSIGLSSAVTLADNTTLSFGEPAYTSNGFTDMAATGQGVLTGILSSCAGKLSYVNGKFVMFAGASVTPEMTITDDNLLAPVQITTANGKGESFNSVKAIFVDSINRYVATDTPTYTSTSHLTADTPSGESSANYRKTLELQFPFTTTSAMAQRLQKINLLHHRQEVGVSLLTNIGFMQLQPFDHVYLTNERLGFEQKRFEVLSQKLELVDTGNDATPSLATRLNLKEIDPAVYNFLQSDYEDIQENGEDNDTGDRSVTAPTGLALTQRTEVEGATVKADIEASWTNNADDLIMGTEIAYKLSTDADYEGHIVVGKGETKGLIPNVVLGKTYNVKVRHLAQTNVYSDYTSAVNITISDPTTISPPSSLQAVGNPLGIVVSFVNPNTTAYRATKVYRKTNNSAPTDDTNLVATIAGEPNKVSFIQQGKFDGLTAGTTYYFWVRAVTFTGTESNLAGSVNASFDDLGKGDVGLDNVTNDTQVKFDLSNLSIESDLFEIQSQELRGKNAIKNAEITSSDVVGPSGKLFTALPESGATIGAQAGSNLKDSGGNSLGDVDVRNSDLSVDFTGNTTFRIKKGSTVIDTQAFDKGNVGLSDLASLDSTQDTKLTNIEANATVGAKAGVNLKRNNNAVIGDADIITSEGTSDDTENVNSVAKADITGSITGTQSNVAGIVQGLAAGTQSVNAGVLNAGQINTSLLKIDELFLPTEGTATAGQTVSIFSTMTQVSLGSIGDGPGFYMGTVSFDITDAQNDDIRGASIHIDLKSGNTVVYTKYFPIGIKEGNQYYDAGDQFGDTNDLPVMHLEFAYFHTANTALNLFINADSNDTVTTCLVKARAVRFGAETVTFNPTSVSSATVSASTTVTFSAVTVSGFTGTKTVNLSGNSTALISVNSGTFVNTSIPAISANQTFQVKITSSSTAGTSRSATVEIGGTSITFTVITTGTYTPQYSGGGGGGSAGGGFESNTQLE